MAPSDVAGANTDGANGVMKGLKGPWMNVQARRKSKFIANENGNKGSRSKSQWSKFEALQKMRETLGLEEGLDGGSSALLMFSLAHIGGILIGARNFRLNALKES
ncbi:hypothetical protein L3X38_037767 [Prunus dulcis]|uniref:Uncharacterized protein n=1 Tax=Prunus dulcis TaxID=3755 RepID=A0AAD4V412_PRUDU|nr:hypothetical protein L3X38_037767 [Prunus dulcis]